jgi:hypothetical protein
LRFVPNLLTAFPLNAIDKFAVLVNITVMFTAAVARYFKLVNSINIEHFMPLPVYDLENEPIRPPIQHFSTP